MKTKYLILTLENEWVATADTLSQAKIEAKNARLYSNEVYIYKAQKVKQYN